VNIMVCSVNRGLRHLLRKFYNQLRLLTHFLSYRLARVFFTVTTTDGAASFDRRDVILNIQYIHAFSDLELAIGSVFKERGHRVVALVCGGMRYCERMDYQLSRPNCADCRRETVRHCRAYGLNVIQLPSTLETELGREGHITIGISEFVFRNYVHYFKSFGSWRADMWNLIWMEAAKFERNVAAVFSGLFRPILVTANGRFFQTGIAVEMCKKFKGDILTTEAFAQDGMVTLGRNTFSLNQELEISRDQLTQIAVPSSVVDELFSKQKEWMQTTSPATLAADNVVDLRNRLLRWNGGSFKRVTTFFPHVVWDSTWMGLGNFSASIGSFVRSLVTFAKYHPDHLVVVKLHPAENARSKFLRASSALSADLALQAVSLPSNFVCLEANSTINSYQLALASDDLLVWSGTIGLELMDLGRAVISVANSYYSHYGITNNVYSERELNLTLESQPSINLPLAKKDLAKKIMYLARMNRRFKSPFHFNTICSKFLYFPFTKKQRIFFDAVYRYALGEIDAVRFGNLVADKSVRNSYG